MAASSTWPVTEGEWVTRGDPWTIVVPVRENGVAVDPSDWTWRAQVRSTADSPIITSWIVTAQAAGDVLGGDELTEAGVAADDVVIVMHLPANETARIHDGDQFDLERITPEPPMTLWHATIRARKDISHG